MQPQLINEHKLRCVITFCLCRGLMTGMHLSVWLDRHDQPCFGDTWSHSPSSGEDLDSLEND